MFLRKREDLNLMQSGSRERKVYEQAKIVEGQRKQLEKHVKRLAMTKEKMEYEKQIALVRPGSGHNWIN